MKNIPHLRKSPCLFSNNLYDICCKDIAFDKIVHQSLRLECYAENVTEEEVQFDVDYLRRMKTAKNKFCRSRIKLVRLLNACCPIADEIEDKDHPTLLSYSVPQYKVFSFVRRASKLIFDDDIFLYNKNLNASISASKHFIGMSGNGVFNPSALMKKLKFQNRSENIFLKALVHGFIYFVRTLLKIFFYVTSTPNQEFTVLYYRNRVWRMVVSKFYIGAKNDGFLKRSSFLDVRRAVEDGSCLGVGQMRLIPNLSTRTLRPICSFGKIVPLPGIACAKISAKEKLFQLLDIFRNFRVHFAVIPGFRSRKTGELFSALRKFRQQNNSKGQDTFFLVKCDIKEFYSNVDQLILLEEVKRLFQKALKICDIGDDILRSQFEILQKFINNQYIKCGNFYVKYERGIPQGASISPFLCHFYLLRMEKECLSIKKDDLMLRLVDDILFVSPSQNRANAFLQQLKNGLSSFKLSLNESKIQATTSGQEIDWLGFRLLPNLDVCVHPSIATNCCKFGGDHLSADACINRIKHFVPNLAHFRPAFDSSNTPETILNNQLTLTTILAARVRIHVKSSSEKAELLGGKSRLLSDAIVYRLMKISCHNSMIYRNCIEKFIDSLRCYRGEFHSVIKYLQRCTINQQ